jgi:hypothetical protein
MKKEEENMDWEKESPQLATLNKSNSFYVPDNYFENLSEQIINQVALKEINLNDLGFNTPSGYFENFENQLYSKIKLEEKTNLLIENNYGFEVPENYFEKSKIKIVEGISTKNKSNTKVTSLKFIRYAAAACILLTTTFGIYFNIQQTKNINYQLSKISNEEIETYLNQNIDASDVTLILQNLESKPVFTIEQSQLSDVEIKNYLDSTY